MIDSVNSSVVPIIFDMCSNSVLFQLLFFIVKAYKGNSALGKWVSKQRDAYRDYQAGGTNPRMTREKVDKLLSIGFKFFIGKGKAVRRWDDFFNTLVAFKEKFGEKREILLTNLSLSMYSYFLNIYIKKGIRIFLCRLRQILSLAGGLINNGKTT